METALEILARLGTDNAPTVEELRSARDTIARELHALKGKGGVDLEALMSVREAYTLADTAVTEAEAKAEEATEEIDNILADIPNPDAEAVEPEEAPANEGEVLSIQESLARLGLTAPVVTSEPVAQVISEPNLATVTHSVQIGTDVRDDASWRDLAEAFVESGRSLKTGKERVARISTEFAEERTLSGKIGDNTRLIDSFVSPEAVSAAGGCCSLAQPIYENPVVGSLARPIRDSLPTVGATRGKVEFFPAICLPQAGAALWTCEDDAAVVEGDPNTWKDCVEVQCDDTQVADVEAIYKCLTIGNYQARFAPEQWEGHLKAVAVAQARLAEVALFDKMRANVTSTHTGLDLGSMYANFVNTFIRASALIRQDQRLDEVQLHAWAPRWVLGAINEDWIARRINKGGDLQNVEQLVAQALSNEGINITYTLDVDDIEDFQYDGALAAYPALASTVLAPEGYFSFLDGGSFDLGTEIRDHDLNRQNKVAAFAESFEGLLARGCNAKALDIPVDVCNSIPCP